jgi:hypothetical protein
MEKYVQFREVLHPSGVYMLLRHEKVVYVGKSLNIFARLSRHYTNLQRKRAGKPPYGNHAGPVIEFDDVQARFLPVDELDREEVKLILLHLPEFNMHHNYVPKDLTHIPAFRELLLKAKASGRFTTVDRMPFGFTTRPTPKRRVPSLPMVRF